MAGKRKYQDQEPEEAVHESRKLQVYGDKPKIKKRRQAGQTPKTPSTVSELKKQIRNVRRRLEGLSSLPADLRREDERALAAYEQELATLKAEKAREKILEKYHMVRFFERQKATRYVKKARKRILEAQSTEEVEALKKELHVAEVDLNYTMFCPLGEKYVGIYSTKKAKDDGNDDTLKDPSQRPPMWIEVEKCMEDGTLEQLRNRVTVSPSNDSGKPSSSSRPLQVKAAKPKPIFTPAPDTTGLNRRERRRKMRGEEPRVKTKSKSAGFEKNQAFGAYQATIANGKKADDEDDSDGGFFE